MGWDRKTSLDGWHVRSNDEWDELEDFISNDGHPQYDQLFTIKTNE